MDRKELTKTFQIKNIRQILTSNVDSRAVRVKLLKANVSQIHVG